MALTSLTVCSVSVWTVAVSALYDEDIASVRPPVDEETFDYIDTDLSAEDLEQRRRMQFTTTTSGPPTEPPSMPPTPLGSTVYRDNTNPYVYVDFETHISWDSANEFCEDQIGTQLASVDRLNMTRINETEQIDLMVEMCKGKGNATEYYSDHPDCWIGLKYSPSTTLFEWKNGQSLDPPTNPNGASQTGWRPGKNTPTAFTFLSGETTVCTMCYV